MDINLKKKSFEEKHVIRGNDLKLCELSLLIKNKDFDKAVKFSKNNSCFEELILLLSDNKNYRTAFRILKDAQIDCNNYPELIIRSKKAYFRFIYSSFNVEFVELRFYSQKEFLVYLAEELNYKGYIDLSLSVVYRHDLSKYPLKKELTEILSFKYSEVKNSLLYWNEFSPLENFIENSNKFLKLSDLGLKENNITVFYTLEHLHAAQDALRNLRLKKVLGFDTEGDSNFIPFENQKIDLLQIADDNNIYIFNLRVFNSHEFFDLLKELFFDKNILKLGFCFKNDIKNVENIYKDYKIYVTNYIDICELTAALYLTKKIKLSEACNKVLGKSLSKLECFLLWSNHPLKKYQLHYAALDAYVLVKIYEKLKKEFNFEKTEYIDNFGSEY